MPHSSTPADYFKPVLESARIFNTPAHDISSDELKNKVIESLRVNFLHLFQSRDNHVATEPDNLLTSQHTIDIATKVVQEANERYSRLVNRDNLFAYYLEEDDLELTNRFRTGEALRYMEDTLVPYLADLCERGVCTIEDIEEKYSEFLGMTPGKDWLTAENFWDSSAVMLYSSQQLYKQMADSLTADSTELSNQNPMNPDSEPLRAESVARPSV